MKSRRFSGPPLYFEREYIIGGFFLTHNFDSQEEKKMANRNRKTKKENRVKSTVAAASDKLNDRLPKQKITEKARASLLIFK